MGVGADGVFSEQILLESVKCLFDFSELVKMYDVCNGEYVLVE